MLSTFTSSYFTVPCDCGLDVEIFQTDLGLAQDFCWDLLSIPGTFHNLYYSIPYVACA